MKNPEVWIELRNIDDAYNNRSAQMMTQMLIKAGCPEWQTVWWNSRKGCYCLDVSASGEFLELRDHGHWFPLQRFIQ